MRVVFLSRRIVGYNLGISHGLAWMYAYDRKRSNYFVAFAPAVVGYVAVLLPVSIACVWLGVGAVGVIGLVALLYAWVCLRRPGRSPGAMRLMRLGLSIGLGASVLMSIGMVVAWIPEPDLLTTLLFLPMTGVGVLAAWFLAVSFPGRVRETRASQWIAYGLAGVLGLHAMASVVFVYSLMIGILHFPLS